MLRTPSKNNLSNIRDLFAREHKEKVPPDLRYALRLLRLDGFEDLEERFLSTDAFLRPWSVFRDSIFLMSPDAMPHATQIFPMGTEFGTSISRLAILWFYTQFDEGSLRYDSRTKYSKDLKSDTRVYAMIDKSKWRIEDYEKHLYVWLLQEFKVGKGYSPWRFECFELKNICTVWEEVFVPIVNAVRASYDPKGRRHYGRLALYIEARCHSKLAFPDSNTGPLTSEVLLTPYRVVSMPKSTFDNHGATLYQGVEDSYGILSKKHYDATERELRDVYPQYGGLVERPKFKHKMDEWLAQQRARAHRRKVGEKQGHVQSHQPQVVQQHGSPNKQLPKSPTGSCGRRDGCAGPIKRCSDTIRRSFSGMRIKDEQKKSPLHGVTRQLHFPERCSSQTENSIRNSIMITPLPRPEQFRKPEPNVYTPIRTSDPLTRYSQDELNEVKQAHANNAESTPLPSVFSPMAQLSAIPRPLKAGPDGLCVFEPESPRDVKLISEYHSTYQKKSYYDVRVPSYEGTEYQKEISLIDLHTRPMSNAARSLEIARSKTPVTRLPAPIVPIPYAGLRIASADTPTDPILPLPKPVISPPRSTTVTGKPAVAPLKSIAWPGTSAPKPSAIGWRGNSPPKSTAWPGFDSDDDEFAPPTPSKSPEHHIHNPRSRRIFHEEREHDMSRIVSKENIRAALGGTSCESSAEDLVLSKPFVEPVRIMSPMRQQLQTYNTHLFLRKDGRRGTAVDESE